MTANIKGGINIAMKVPPHQFDETVRFYRDIVGLEPYDEKAPEIGFKLGPISGFVESRLQNVYTKEKGFVDTKSIQQFPVVFGLVF